MAKKLIGIPATKFENSMGVSTEMLAYLRQFGRVVMLMPDEYLEVDLVVMGGGADIEDNIFSPLQQTPNPALEYWDKEMLPIYLENETPIFAICRGFQRLVSTVYGLQLTKHIEGHSNVEHLATIGGDEKTAFLINSRHHQAFLLDNEARAIPGAIFGHNLSQRTFDECKTKESKQKTLDYTEVTLEGFHDPERKLAGVQYHPESMNWWSGQGGETISTNILKALLNE